MSGVTMISSPVELKITDVMLSDAPSMFPSSPSKSQNKVVDIAAGGAHSLIIVSAEKN